MSIYKNRLIKKIVIIGFGSIGKKHFSILRKKNYIIKVITNQKISNKIKLKRSKIQKFNPDYIVIASKTSKHLSDLKYIEKNINKKLVLIEKPLYENYKNIKLKNNKYLVGYNLRFHPIIQFLKKEKLKPYFVQSNCFSYLPDWRKNIHYSRSNTADKIGGGVALELSHEIDYLIWMFGNFKKINILNKKISNLKIDKDDIFIFNANYKSIYLNISINIFSKINKRELFIYTKKKQYYADLNKNRLLIYFKNKIKTISWKNFYISKTYEIEHNLMLRKKFNDFCTVDQANNLLKIIKS